MPDAVLRLLRLGSPFSLGKALPDGESSVRIPRANLASPAVASSSLSSQAGGMTPGGVVDGPARAPRASQVCACVSVSVFVSQPGPWG